MPIVKDYVRPYPDQIPYKAQGVEVPGSKSPGQTGHYRNGIWGLVNEATPNVLVTLDQIFESGLRVGKDQAFLGHRPIISTNPLKFAPRYVWQTWGEVDYRRRCIGSALSTLFNKGELGGGEFRSVGLWSQNRPEWQIVDSALAAYNMVNVSIYDTLGKDVVEYIIDHSHLSVVFTTTDHIPTLLKLKSKVPMLKLIVSFDELSSDAKTILGEWSQTQDVKVMGIQEFEAFGKANWSDPIRARPDQLASICYTSGTTSNPKGVLLTHSMLALSCQSNLCGLQLPDDGSMISYLPLAHIYERIAELCTIACGGRIGYFTGDPLRLLEDCQILKPNIFPSVPRVLNRIYQAAMAAGNVSGVKGALFRKAMQAKLEKMHTTGDNNHAFWDRLVFRKIQAVLGGQISLVTCGSAPIHAEVLDFLKIALSCEVLEGYGLTETCGTTTRSWPLDASASGTVGPPQPANEIKLIDVPSMNYTSEDKPRPRGELCVRGPNTLEIYYKDEKNTRESVDDEGWFHTGDVAEIDEFGRFKIVDRVKNIMKLSQGEYVALEKIENTYSSSPVIGQIYVHGDSLQSYLLAVVIPDPVQLAAVASRVTGDKVTPENGQALVNACKDERVNKAFLNLLGREAKKGGLKGFETIKRIHLTLNPFTVEDGTLTPTLKIRRKDAYNKFKQELDALYALGEPGTSKM